MPRTTPTDFLALLKVLRNHGVDFIVVGGVGAVLHGAPVSTFDLDVVHSRDDANIERLLGALDELESYYRTQPEKRLRPGASHLSSPGHQLLMTRFGPLDLLCAVGRSRDYTALLRHSVEMLIGQGVHVHVLSLETLIAVKEETAGDKDLATLPILHRTLAEKSKP
ncbi:MAG TPA: hypothetical protein VLE22_22250 [Bryobacteraceae bacterium]|nr:hypothetical protein [Bryobacteraceae bacterium]